MTRARGGRDPRGQGWKPSLIKLFPSHFPRAFIAARQTAWGAACACARDPGKGGGATAHWGRGGRGKRLRRVGLRVRTKTPKML